MQSYKIGSIERLRGLAALCVLLCHVVGQFYGVTRYSPGPERLLGWAGQVGVAVFFVISGFCIRLPLARARQRNPRARLDVREYLTHRALRILPPYWVAIALSLAVGALSPTGLLPGADGPADVVVHGLALHTLWPSSFASINGVFWTIGLEAQFYVAYLLVAHRRAGLGALALCLAGGVAIYGAVSLAFPSPSPWRQVGQEIVFATFWQWYLGVVLADAYVRFGRAFQAEPPGVAWVLRIAAGLACLGLGWGDPVAAHVHLTYWALPFAATALTASLLLGRPDPAREGAVARVLTRVGRSSYSLYLLHPCVLALTILVLRDTGLPPWSGALLALAGSLATAAAGYRLVERPLLARKARQAGAVLTASGPRTAGA